MKFVSPLRTACVMLTLAAAAWPVLAQIPGAPRGSQAALGSGLGYEPDSLGVPDDVPKSLQ